MGWRVRNTATIAARLQRTHWNKAVLIEEYFQQIESGIARCVLIVESMLVKDKRSLHLGLVEGKLSFVDSSILHFVEYVNVKDAIARF